MIPFGTLTEAVEWVKLNAIGKCSVFTMCYGELHVYDIQCSPDYIGYSRIY